MSEEAAERRECKGERMRVEGGNTRKGKTKEEKDKKKKKEEEKEKEK